MNIFYSKLDNTSPGQMTRFVNPRTEAYNLLSININWDMTEAFDWNMGGAHIILTARTENLLDASAWQLEWVRRNINSLPVAPGRGFFGGLTVRF
jgi:outer membrane receptor protein involved in Fe transport